MKLLELAEWEGWENAIANGNGFLILRKRVPFLRHFRVRWGGRRFPVFVDGKHRFRCLGCERIGFRKYRVRVSVKPKNV